MKKELSTIATTATTVVSNVPAKVEPGNDKPEAKKHVAKKIKTAAELQAEIAAKTEELEKTLKELERKQKINEKRTIFLETLDMVKDFDEQLKKDEENFQSDGMKLAFYGTKYANKPDFSVSARPILQDFIVFIADKIEKRIKELENELIK